MKQKIILRNITRICLAGAFLFVSSYSYSQNRESLPVARKFVINDKIAQAVSCYAQLVSKEKENATLLAEYAYALSLSGVYEGALMNLDRAKLLGSLSAESYFYIGQVFSLMGYDWVTREYVKKSTIPNWIASYYEELYYKYKQVAAIHYEDSETAFNRANYLAANGMNFQSIALYEQILEENPDEYLFHVGYSIPLEKVGLRELAAKEMSTGLSLLPDGAGNNRTKQAFEGRLSELRQRKDAKPIKQGETPGLKSQGMLYIGGMFSSSYMSFNSRFGLFFTNSFNASIDLGISDTSDNTYTNLGLSLYQRLGNALVIGIGVNDQITDSDNISIKPSIGLSFLNKNRTSSWDIFFDVYCPVAENANYMYGFSIGKSFYFGKRK